MWPKRREPATPVPHAVAWWCPSCGTRNVGESPGPGLPCDRCGAPPREGTMAVEIRSEEE